MKLERWRDVILSRPDPQAIWKPVRPELWRRADAKYSRSRSGGGSWSFYKTLPPKWTVQYDSLKFYVEPTGFKHTGLFPEQAANWDWMRAMVSRRAAAGGSVRVLNLFGYTGGATAAVSEAGAEVCHVDAVEGHDCTGARKTPSFPAFPGTGSDISLTTPSNSSPGSSAGGIRMMR